MKSILHFLFILFLEIGCGITLAFLYGLFSYLLFTEDFGHGKINEGIYYLVTLLPPFIYCWMEYLGFKRKGDKNKSVIVLSAGIAYLLVGLVFMMIWTDFYLING